MLLVARGLGWQSHNQFFNPLITLIALINNEILTNKKIISEISGLKLLFQKARSGRHRKAQDTCFYYKKVHSKIVHYHENEI